MATLTPDSVELQDFGQVEVREAELDGYSVTFLHVKQPVDMAFMLRGLPGDLCPCPHWGIVTDGQMTVRYPGREEVVRTGDVFYMVPGHTPEYQVGTRLILFSPTEEMKQVDEVIMKNVQALQGTPSTP